MKHRTMKKLLTAVLSAAMLATAIPADLTPAQAAEKAPDATSTLDELGIIDAEGEEDTTSDLPDSFLHILSSSSQLPLRSNSKL